MTAFPGPVAARYPTVRGACRTPALPLLTLALALAVPARAEAQQQIP
ncbi:MAG: hypothetical protein U5K76_13875 [Woeseiaceae bacterium]|nr:hypothetical protein [Woeseiaceae bacterium]